MVGSGCLFGSHQLTTTLQGMGRGWDGGTGERLLLLLIICQISPGFAFKWSARWNPTLWNYRQQSLPLNSLGKRIMSLSSDNVASLDTSSSNNVEENLPGASKGARPSNWLSVFLLLLNQLQSVKNIAVSLEYQIG